MDKGGVIVIMNKEDYILEGLHQLNNMDHFRTLGLDQTSTFNEQIKKNQWNRILDQYHNFRWSRNIAQQITKDFQLLYVSQN